MRKFPFPRIHGPDHDLCIRSINFGTLSKPLTPMYSFAMKSVKICHFKTFRAGNFAFFLHYMHVKKFVL